MRFGDIFDKINPFCEGYRVLYLDEKGECVEKFYVDLDGLDEYRDWCLQSVSAYSDTLGLPCLSFAISREFF